VLPTSTVRFRVQVQTRIFHIARVLPTNTTGTAILLVKWRIFDHIIGYRVVKSTGGKASTKKLTKMVRGAACDVRSILVIDSNHYLCLLNHLRYKRSVRTPNVRRTISATDTWLPRSASVVKARSRLSLTKLESTGSRGEMRGRGFGQSYETRGDARTARAC